MGRRRVNKDPLRKIVADRYEPATDRVVEILECGHEVRRREDVIGETNAYRRRCRKCRKDNEGQGPVSET